MTSSAEPDRLEEFSLLFTPADEQLTSLAADLDASMETFSAGAGAFLPVGFATSWGGTLVRGLRDESRHLAGWVASVGLAFREADRLDVPADRLDVFIADRVGEPTMWEAEQERRGIEDANALRRQLQALGINTGDFDPSQLQNLELSPDDPRYMQLFDLMKRLGGNMWSEDYASGLYDQLDADGIRATLGVIETFAAHQVWRPTDRHGRPMGAMVDLGSIKDQLLLRFALGFARASGSVDLSEERQELLNPGSDVNGDPRWKQHQLSLLLSAPGHEYDPGFLAGAADVILVSNRGTNWINTDWGTSGSPYDTDYPPLYIGPDLWGGDIELGVPQALALRALAGNDEAAWQFATMGSDNLEAILRPDTAPVERLRSSFTYTGYEYEDVERLEGLMAQYGADVTNSAFVDVPLADPSRYPQALDNFADVVRIVGDGDIPDVTKRTVANASGLYLGDIGDAVVRQSQTSYADDGARAAEDFNRPDLVDFFAEVATDDEAAAQVGESVTYWAEQRTASFLAHPEMGESQVNELYRPVSLVMGSVEDGFEAADADARQAHAAFAKGARHVTAFGAGALSAAAAAPLGPGGVFVAWGVGGAAGSLVTEQLNILAMSAPGVGIDGNDVEVAMVEQLREDLAITVAAERGWDTPKPGEHGATLARAFPHMDVVGRLDESMSDSERDYDDDDHWSAR